jgi:hypothetical protein
VLKADRPANPYAVTTPFTSGFNALFGEHLPKGASYHLSRAMVVHHSSALGERVERYFALVILTRNLTVACAGVAIGLLFSAELKWAAIWAVTAVLFWYQYRRFLKTEARAVFGAATVVLAGKIDAPPLDRNTVA